MKDLVIDYSLFEKMGMTVLKEKPIRTQVKIVKEFPKDREFRPKGVTLEEAREAMKRCKNL